MSIAKVIAPFRKLCIHQPSLALTVRSISLDSCSFFKSTPCLMAEPLKKKKRVDPAVIRAREERKKRKIEKQIRRLEKHTRQLKPLSECEVPLALLDQKLERQRGITHSGEILEQRALLEKKWANFKRMQLLDDLQMIDRVLFAQQKALDELRQESEELYQEAIQADFHLVPFKTEGPVETPAIENYDAPDGEYEDVSKKW